MNRTLLKVIFLVILLVNLICCKSQNPEDIEECVNFSKELDKIKEKSGQLVEIVREAPADHQGLSNMTIEGGNVMMEYSPLLEELSDLYEIPCKEKLAKKIFGLSSNREAIVRAIYMQMLPIIEHGYIYLSKLKIYAVQFKLTDETEEITEQIGEFKKNMMELREYCTSDVGEEECAPFVADLKKILEVE